MPVSLLIAQSDVWSLILWRTMPALGITLAFAFIAYGLRAVTASGAIAGLIVTYSIFLAAGPAGFLAVLTVFVLTMGATRFSYARKRSPDGMEARIDAHGRDAAQVYANLLPAALVAIPAIFHPRAGEVLFIGMCAVLAEAAADTVSSEVGQAFEAPTYLITTWRSTPIGDNGGMSVVGTSAGVIAAFIVAFACAWMRLLDFRGFVIAAVAGIAGMLLDSYLGATLERPNRLGNNSVNFTSTVFAACLALVAMLILK